MDSRTFLRLAEGVLQERGHALDTPDRDWLYEDARLIVRGAYPHYRLTRLEVLQPLDGAQPLLVSHVADGRLVLHDDAHRALQDHLIGLARELDLAYVGVPDKIAPLRALDERLAGLEAGDREADAALWWIFADHSDTDPDDLAEAALRGPATYLDRIVGPRVWREPEGVGMVPKLSTSLDALRHYTHAHLPGWGREMIEPDGDRPESDMPTVRLWRGSYETPAIAAPTLELAAFRAAVHALLAVETGQADRPTDPD